MTKTMHQKNKPLTAEDLLTQALEEQAGNDLTFGEMRLLTAGYKALREQQGKPLTKTELPSIYSLIAYVAYTQKINEETVTEILLAKYNSKTVQKIPSHHFMGAVEYLVDLEINKVRWPLFVRQDF